MNYENLAVASREEGRCEAGFRSIKDHSKLDWRQELMAKRKKTNGAEQNNESTPSPELAMNSNTAAILGVGQCARRTSHGEVAFSSQNLRANILVAATMGIQIGSTST